MSPPAGGDGEILKALGLLVERFEAASAARLQQHERYCEERQTAFREAMKSQTAALSALVDRIEDIDQRRREGVQQLHRRLDDVEARATAWRAGAIGRVVTWQHGVIGLLIAVLGYLLTYGRPWLQTIN